MRSLKLLLPVAAFIAILPALHGGWPCGKDLPFHLQSWWDAAQQMHSGVLHPRWIFAAAYNSGEPRFVFYPPLSWELGGALASIVPLKSAAPLFTWIVLSLAGLSMHRLARMWLPDGPSFLAGCVYMANPYMLYTVAMRGAFGELLAAVACPLLFAAMLRRKTTLWSIGGPIALFWLSNVPGAIIGSYLFALLATIRLVYVAWTSGPEERARSLVRSAATYLLGFCFGLALAAFFLVPAIWERRYIRMDDAYSPGMRPYDNLLLQRHLDPVRDYFLLHIEHISVFMAAATGIALLSWWWWERKGESEASTGLTPKATRVLLSVVCAATLFLLLAPSAILWKHLPALWVAQLPWRVLFVLGCCMALAWAFVASHARISKGIYLIAGLACVAALACFCVPTFRWACTTKTAPETIEASLARHHSPEPTEEYVLDEADAEYMQPDNPPFWLTQDPAAFAPGTTPNTTHSDPAALMPVAPEGAHLSATPLDFHLTSPEPQFLVINLERYPNWTVMINANPVVHFAHREDGLIAFAVPRGTANVHIQWRHSPDEWIGLALSVAAGLLWFRFSYLTRRVGTALPSAP